MVEYTEAEKRLAREIADKQYINPEDQFLWSIAYDAALAAIREATEGAADYAAGSPSDEPRELVAQALRNGEHLK